MDRIGDILVARTPLKKRKKTPKDVQPSLRFSFGSDLQYGYIANGFCPKIGCPRKLYWNRAQTIIRCKSKLHSFVLTKKAYEDIVSGKRLNDYKEQRRIDLR